MVHIGKNVRYLRTLKGVPQKEIADKLNMIQQTYSKIELKEDIPEKMLQKIADVLQYPIEAFHLPDLGDKVNNIFQNNGDHASVFSYNYNNSDKLEALYEKLLGVQQLQIEELRKRLKKFESE